MRFPRGRRAAALSMAAVATVGLGATASVLPRLDASTADSAPPARAAAAASLGELPAAWGAPPRWPARRAVRRLPSARQIASARRFVAGRRGRVAFAVIGTSGQLSGLHAEEPYRSASVTKAMLLMAYLRQPHRRRRSLADGSRTLLGPMVRRSDNGAASAIYQCVGDPGLRALARRAGMKRFSVAGHWANARVTAADQVRLFIAVDRLVFRRHRGYARMLLSRVVPEQRWGIPRAARPDWRVLFKGGWRLEAGGHLVHQAARLERGTRRLAIARADARQSVPPVRDGDGAGRDREADRVAFGQLSRDPQPPHRPAPPTHSIRPRQTRHRASPPAFRPSHTPLSRCSSVSLPPSGWSRSGRPQGSAGACPRSVGSSKSVPTARRGGASTPAAGITTPA